MFSTPILFLTFNRFDTAKQVFARIKHIQPQKLFLASDGPRHQKEGEAQTVKAIRDWMLSEIDWQCEVHTLFRDENLGCGKAVSSAITWFFEHAESGIILEDDCLPSDSFFTYCETLLTRYKADERVMHISGNNPLGAVDLEDATYYCAKVHHCWGWASWRRAWNHYRFDITKKEVRALCRSECYRAVFHHKGERVFWKKLFMQMTAHKIDTWDYQWEYAILAHNGICISPARNLVSNIGFASDALHTTDVTSSQNNQARYELTEYIAPAYLAYNQDLCDKMSEEHFHIVTHHYAARTLQKAVKAARYYAHTVLCTMLRKKAD